MVKRTLVRSDRPRRILVVDDNTDVAELTGELLTEMGHTVRIANDGAAALELLATFEAEIALLDLGLPVMDGYELARRVRATAQNQPYLVAVTGYGRASDQALVAAAGFDTHLVKPVSIETLVRIIEGVKD